MTAERVWAVDAGDSSLHRAQRVKGPDRRVPTGRVESKAKAASREGQLCQDQEQAPVDGVGDRASEEGAGEHGHDLGQADQSHI